MVEGESVLYRTCTPVVDAEYDENSVELPTKTLVDAIAEAADTSPLELPPLYEFADPDVIERLLNPKHNPPEREMTLGFQIQRWNVYVRSDGRIRVCDATQPTNPRPVFSEC